MLYLILTTLIMLALLDRTLRGGRVRLLKLDLEFKLFALRDELRNDAIAGEISYNNWFDYMDTTLTRTIGATEKVNPWLAVGLLYIHREDSDLFCAYEQLREALRRPENHRIEEIYLKFIECVGDFLKARYRISWPLAAIIFALFRRQKHVQHESVEQEEQELAPIFSIAPETSTLREYSHAVNGSHPHVPTGELALR